MATYKYAIGQEVQVTGDSAKWQHLVPAGSTVTINDSEEDIAGLGYRVAYLNPDEGIENWWVAEEDIALVTEAEGAPSGIQAAVDSVNHPPHYNRFPVEVIEITEQLPFNQGNVVKYVARAGFKAGVDELEDLNKAAWYLSRAIEKLKKERAND